MTKKTGSTWLLAVLMGACMALSGCGTLGNSNEPDSPAETTTTTKKTTIPPRNFDAADRRTRTTTTTRSWRETESTTTTHRIGLTTAYNKTMARGKDPDSYKKYIPDLEAHIYSEMEHSCTAPTIYVKDMPLFMDPYNGLYTGEWKGAGPCGKGVLTCARNDEFYSYANYYSGDLVAGVPDGTGVISMSKRDGGQVYFEEGSFSGGEPLSDIPYVEFDGNGDYVGQGRGQVYMDNGINYDITYYDKACDPTGALVVARFVATLVLANKLYDSTSPGPSTMTSEPVKAWDDNGEQRILDLSYDVSDIPAIPHNLDPSRWSFSESGTRTVNGVEYYSETYNVKVGLQERDAAIRAEPGL